MPRLPRFLSPVTRLGQLFGRRPVPAAPTIIRATGPTLEGIGLRRGFGSGDSKTLAVNDVTLDLRQGEMNLLMGPSGSGKSTLLAVLSALLRPDGGRVRALGHDIWRFGEQELERFRLKHCSYIFQGYNLFPSLTARQQLEVVLRWGERVGPAEARRRADKVLGQLGLGKRSHLRPAQLSGGEKQRVAIARALVKNPSFVFADEPTSALDWENGQHVISLLRDVARNQGATVLVVTHDHRLVPYADRVFEMADGRLQPDPNGTDTGLFNLDPTMVELSPEQPGLRLKLEEPVYSGH
ncbi:MAG: ABC transporter ATP-binding protein [Gemmataceae bacterium]